MILHDNPLSSNAQKVRFLLGITGVPYDRRKVPFDQPRPDWHLAVNPSGGIPALVDDEVELAESNAILRYLAAREGRDDLYPLRAADGARVDWILDHVLTWFRPASRVVEASAFGLRPGGGLFAAAPESPEQIRQAVASQLDAFQVTEDLLADEGGYACLGRLTLADIAGAPFLHRLDRAGGVFDDLPRLGEWASIVLAHPAWAAVALEAGV